MLCFVGLPASRGFVLIQQPHNMQHCKRFKNEWKTENIDSYFLILLSLIGMIKSLRQLNKLFPDISRHAVVWIYLQSWNYYNGLKNYMPTWTVGMQSFLIVHNLLSKCCHDHWRNHSFEFFLNGFKVAVGAVVEYLPFGFFLHVMNIRTIVQTFVVTKARRIWKIEKKGNYI